jgi:predicted nucleic acid-binding protein
MRYVLDTSTGIRLLNEPDLLDRLAEHVESEALELLMPATIRRELLANNQLDRQPVQRLLDLCRPVPDGGFIVGVSAVGESRIGDPFWIEILRQGNPKHNNDALIAAATRFEDAGLLTDDNRQARQTQKLMRSAPTLENLLRHSKDDGTAVQQ